MSTLQVQAEWQTGMAGEWFQDLMIMRKVRWFPGDTGVAEDT